MHISPIVSGVLSPYMHTIDGPRRRLTIGFSSTYQPHTNHIVTLDPFTIHVQPPNSEKHSLRITNRAGRQPGCRNFIVARLKG